MFQANWLRLVILFPPGILSDWVYYPSGQDKTPLQTEGFFMEMRMIEEEILRRPP
jgi:hypothetical protein